jgi:hypothetical protein
MDDQRLNFLQMSACTIIDETADILETIKAMSFTGKNLLRRVGQAASAGVRSLGAALGSAAGTAILAAVGVAVAPVVGMALVTGLAMKSLCVDLRQM